MNVATTITVIAKKILALKDRFVSKFKKIFSIPYSLVKFN